MSKIIWEILTILWYGVTGTLGAIGNAIWAMLPSMLELRKVQGYFTPEGMIALSVGVPTFVVSLLFFAMRKVIEKCH